MVTTGSCGAVCSWTPRSAAPAGSRGTCPLAAPPRCRRCSTRWARSKARRITAPSSSVTTTPSRKRAGGCSAGCLPDRAGQPVQLQLQLSLEQYLTGIGRPGRPYLPPGFTHGADPNHPWAGAGEPPPERGWPAMPGTGTGPVLAGPWAGPGDDCDAALAPILTGRIDHDLAGQLAGQLARSSAAPAAPMPTWTAAQARTAAATPMMMALRTMQPTSGEWSGTRPPPGS